MRILVLLHALDRTGPPMLARAFLGWLSRVHPEHRIEIVSFRGGPMIDDLMHFGPVHVLLDPKERWDHNSPDTTQLNRASKRASAAAEADVVLAVSVAAGQVLPHLPRPALPLVTWCVEMGTDLHWIDDHVGLREKTSLWLAGSEASRMELQQLLPGTEIHLSPEFVAPPPAIATSTVANCRASLLGHPDGCVDASSGHRELLVVGTGIATHRKAPDLFAEVALQQLRNGVTSDRFVWIGGEDDPMFQFLASDCEHLGISNLRFLGNVGEVEPWLAGADVLLHTARQDAFPLVCLHAALVGTPVLTWHNNGGSAEMFGNTLLAAQYPDIHALASRLDDLRDHRSRSDVAVAQKSRIEDHFISDVAGPVLLEHLERTAGRSGR